MRESCDGRVVTIETEASTPVIIFVVAVVQAVITISTSGNRIGGGSSRSDCYSWWW